MSRRDPDQQPVYDVENFVWGETLYQEILSVADMDTLVRNLDATPWYLDLIGTPIKVRAARYEATRSRAYYGTRAVSLRDENVEHLTHEIAHQLAWTRGGSGHDASFRRAYVDLAVLTCGLEAAQRLQTAFERAGLPLAERRWPEPPEVGPYGLYGALRAGALA